MSGGGAGCWLGDFGSFFSVKSLFLKSAGLPYRVVSGKHFEGKKQSARFVMDGLTAKLYDVISAASIGQSKSQARSD